MSLGMSGAIPSLPPLLSCRARGNFTSHESVNPPSVFEPISPRSSILLTFIYLGSSNGVFKNFFPVIVLKKAVTKIKSAEIGQKLTFMVLIRLLWLFYASLCSTVSYSKFTLIFSGFVTISRVLLFFREARHVIHRDSQGNAPFQCRELAPEVGLSLEWEGGGRERERERERWQ